ncbi:unnamed protein product [Trichogramma brassicae]|uniref:Uncharacterized protein n=1 Tax=Trichogramma brassicae TaxID=86971 RepID=A0A6H5INQ2_9HYME|nr:unnamed protein product [Trichogramma brassicae]
MSFVESGYCGRGHLATEAGSGRDERVERKITLELVCMCTCVRAQVKNKRLEHRMCTSRVLLLYQRAAI